jgi:drug/metabolite transporter (DMT)-like permease
MELWHVAAALMSALLHAGWNAAVKASPDPAAAMTAQMVMSALIVVPVLLWTGLPAPAAWPWIAASTALNLLTVTALLRAYDLCGFGLAYPVVRALSVLLVVPLAAGLAGERVSPLGLAGIGLVAASLMLVAWGNVGADAVPRAAFGWVALSALTAAAYVMCDAQGVRQGGSAIAYGCVVSITNALLMASVRYGPAGAWRSLAGQARRALPIALASVASYLLILWVWSGAPVAPSAALRDTSAIFAVVIAIVWLRESFTPLRLAAMLLAAAAVPLLRFA